MRKPQLSYEEFAQKTKKVLDDHPMWKHKYRGYINDILKAQQDWEKVVSQYHIASPLYLYSNIGGAGKSKATAQLRYSGQEVAELKMNGEQVMVKVKADENRYFMDDTTTKEQEKVLTSAVPFACGTEEWNIFRKFFESNPVKQNKNAEHTLESKFLTELQKTSSKEKSLTGIQPILLPGGMRFQLTTALAACEAKSDKVGYSQGKYKNSGEYNPDGAITGGGIDILARRKKGARSFPVVIELKDKYQSNERPERAIKQAIAYGVFLRELLRSEEACGTAWYQLFGFQADKDVPLLPESLVIKCAVAMPDIPDTTIKHFSELESIRIEHDILELHCIRLNSNGVVVGCSDGF